MPTNSSSARKARRSNGAGHVENQGYECPAQAACQACAAPLRRRPPAAVGVPFVEAHLRAGHRRPERRDARLRLVAGEGDAREDRRQHRRGEGGRQAARGARRQERRQGGGVRPRQLSLSRARQGAWGCGARERFELLEHDPEKWTPVFRNRSCSKVEHDPEKWTPVFRDRSCSKVDSRRDRTEALPPRRDWKTPWQVNANAADANGTGSARSATASSSTSSCISIAWRRSSRAASALVLRRWS